MCTGQLKREFARKFSLLTTMIKHFYCNCFPSQVLPIQIKLMYKTINQIKIIQ